ncbi:alpha-L-arabinofuranosidase C-terminal domain-containing protein [Alteromonadaceae bacterium BrNp21-10]|nr:alpha-L-arabinofuranosidase C-terminal domain-containing protein [Alteromonadaceae bacterium BrNp21-10]
MNFKNLCRPILAVTLIVTPMVWADTKVALDVEHPGSQINKNIYGQFMEHLGRGIYEGVWVGEDSKIPNTNGYRNDVVKALKELKVPLLRWPGGCFADEYHWQDGIGPRDQRPKGVNTNWGGVIEPNSFGTHEFLNFAEMLGADAYVNGNLGTGTAKEMAQWLEYMTSDSDSTLANMRRANGRDKPWKLPFFAIGNETWGCGGSMTPEFYGHLYKQYASFLKTPADNTPILIASGGTDDRLDWTEELSSLDPVFAYRIEAISHHYYTVPTGVWEKKGNALGFPEEEWASTMSRTLHMEEILKKNLAILDKNDPEKKLGFYVDEWGTWYDVSEGDPGFLYQQNSIRDAVVAALNLNLFHQHAERVQMTIIAQMVNVLQAMILTDKEKMILTPTYHVFRMHTPFQDATYLPVSLTGNPEYKLGEHSVPKISASAAKDKDGKIWITLVNTNPSDSEIIEVEGKYTSLVGEVLSADKMDAHNTFEAPNTVTPVVFKAKASNGKLRLKLPAKSVLVAELK